MIKQRKSCQKSSINIFKEVKMSLFGTYITERKDTNDTITSINSEFVTKMAHMLKFIYQKNKQTTTWIKTIFRTTNTINELLSNCKNNLKNVLNAVMNVENFNSLYNEAINKASNETNIDRSIFAKHDFSEWTYGFLMDDSKVKELLIKNAYTYEAKEYLSR